MARDLQPRSRMRDATLIVLLNLADAIFTLVYIQAGVAREGNPMMAAALSGGAVAFMAAKLALVSLGVLVLVRLRHRPTAAAALSAGALAYAALVAYQVVAMPRLLG